jgi:nucleotide-binding universal stress UspA family protein
VREYYAELEERTAEKLSAQVRSSLGPDMPFRVIVTTGRPSAEIVSAAEEQKVDLVVISTHGRGGIAKAFLGSTTERVLRKAQCPVLVMRSGAAGFVKPTQAED